MRETMRRRTQITAVLGLLVAGMMILAARATAAPAEKYLHVNVVDSTKGENVNVNVPLSMAEQILPAIHDRDLHDGKVSIRHTDMKGVDIRAVLDAVRTAPDNEFVTVTDKDSDVRVAKANGNLVVHAIDKKNREQKVDVTVPLKVVDALCANAANDELDIAAAVRALRDAGDVLLVTVHESTQGVRIWVDSRSTQD